MQKRKNEINYMTSSYSVRKIPYSRIETQNDIQSDKDSDKVKIIELCNVIDEWEKELLFSENGFFSLKGKNVRNKSKEFTEELEKFINTKISEIQFSLPDSKKAAYEIRNLKINNIKEQMDRHEAKELFEWETEVYENAINSNIQKAQLYKSDINVIKKCFNNAVSILNLMSEKEHWSEKIFKSKKDKFISDFYYSIIKAFLDERNINFALFYAKYKDFLYKEQKDELDKIIDNSKRSITAYNWAKEISSYNLDEKEKDKEIKALNDSDLEKDVRTFLEISKKAEKNQTEQKNNADEEKSWNDILSLLDTEPDKAYLYIDFSQKPEVAASQKDYIQKILKEGYIETDKSEYIKLLKEIIAKPLSFKLKSLLKYKNLLSESDFNFFSNLQKEDDEDLKSFCLDCSYIMNRLKNINDSGELYDFFTLYNHSLKVFKKTNSKEADLEKKNQIIEALLERRGNTNEKKVSEDKGKELDKNDGIINKTRKYIQRK